MQGVLDDFQPVIFLGHTSSEKERIVLQQSGVADNERRLQGKASYCGKALSVYLGARTLVLVPSDEFLSTQGAASHPGWTTVIRRVCRTRVPLVVVCLSQASVDQGATDDIAQWASGLRMHLDLITSTRNEDVEVSLVLAQPYRSENAAPPTLMDAWFELLLAMKPLEYPATSSSISLEGLTGELTLDVEKRRWAAQQWVSQRLSGYRQLWPCLLARADESAARVLQYLAAFESLEQLTASLGASLSELLYQD